MADFRDIIGHEQIIEHLQNAIKQNKVSHAYIFDGEKGIGKKTLAEAFAKTLQCIKNEERACGTCKSCLQADGKNHPDIIYVTHEKASLGVDDVREQLTKDMDIKPYGSKYKIYIVDDADKMTEQAQNALLKTIEEPPEYGIVILLTDNINRLLPTILSRCVMLHLKTVNLVQIKEFLMKKYNLPDYHAELSAKFSQGNVGKAIRYGSSEDFMQMKDAVLHLLRYIDDMELYEIMEAIKAHSVYKLEITDYIDLMILWYRDVLMFKVTSDPNVLLYSSDIKYISKQAISRDYEQIENIMNAMDKAKVRLNANVNFDTTIELMLLALKENGNGKHDRS